MHIWVTSFCSVQETRAQAIDDIKAFLASSPAAFPRTREALEALPVVYRERILEYRSRYDPTEHVVPGGRNAAAIDELGLAEFLADFDTRSEEHTSELQSLMRISYAVFCLKKKTKSYKK